jgi:cytochrome c-type biogenesis protein CcmE
MEYYFTPTQINEKYNSEFKNKKIRIGGMVVEGSIHKNADGTNFVITDFTNQINVIYKGNNFPPIFRENVGVIARGYLIDENNFVAEQLIGKHDENYMPKIVGEKK